MSESLSAVTRVKMGASGQPRPKHRPQLHKVRVVTKGGRLHRRIAQKDAWRMVNSGQASIAAQRHGLEKLPRLLVIIDLRAGVDQNLPMGSLSSIYAEDLGNTRFLITSKRVKPDEGANTLVKYDPALTFNELRAGIFESAETRERREIARAERSFLGH